ncbi:MAG TPA: DUF4019 domain-containing protein [Pyrinomonadaceae bacterium]|nr:DUF4019 domain-containing protein [Pyrinomonadaceae bacterium]
MSARRFALGASVLLLFCVFGAAACGIEERQSGLPPSAQAAIDSITNDMARADYEKIYTDAAEEWRRTASREESRANLERIRERLGNVLSRAPLGAQQRESGGDNTTPGRTLVVNYNTKFERADAIETFTLVERSGRWLLARYAVNSNALK